MLATIGWRDNLYKGPTGAPANDPPSFPSVGVPPGAKIGIIAEFRDYRDIILASPNYTNEIGQDLMIVGSASPAPPPPGDLTPDINTQVGAGYEINISGAMHGMNAMRIEWQRNGDTTWSLVGFLTNMPGVVTITPHTPGEPDAGRIRARYIKNNVPVGNYSTDHRVTISA